MLCMGMGSHISDPHPGSELLNIKGAEHGWVVHVHVCKSVCQTPPVDLATVLQSHVIDLATEIAGGTALMFQNLLGTQKCTRNSKYLVVKG